MSITDELRKWGRATLADTSLLVRMEAIADRIDAAVERMVELPKDADEVPWNVGDCDEDGNVVTQLRLSSDGWYAVTDGPSAFHPEQRRHYHAPTVEDVLREVIDKATNSTYTIGDILSEYAAKLRLAGDAE